MQPTFENTTISNSPKHLPKVCIGMPVYNGAAFIRPALDSLLAQTFTDFELIISDNASTDTTGSICQQYVARDCRVKYIKQTVNRGPLANFKFVLDRAKSEYFMWAAADDIWHKDYINRCALSLDQDMNIAVAFAKYWTISRMYSPLKMRHFPDMSFLSDDDPFTRISNFVLLKEPSHKANLIYGLWRRAIAAQMMEAFQDLDDRFVNAGLDIAQLIYVLSYAKAHQVPEVLFFKSYKRFPPGHIGDLILRQIDQLMKSNQLREKWEMAVKEYLSLLQISLERAKVYDERYKTILTLQYDRSMRRHCGTKNVLQEILHSLRSGII